MKEQVKEICLHYLTLCKSRDDYTPAMVASELVDQILALFPQGEGGLLSDEEICKTACGEYAGKCPAIKLNHGCSNFVDIMAVITKQHALDQQHEASALKEQMERVMGVIDKQINSYKDNNPLWINKVTVLEDIKDNLKSQLESE